MKRTDILFVYGTLQRDCPANILMRLRQAEFLGEVTLDGYALYDLGHYPGIVTDEKESVLGEAFRVDDAALTTLDRYENEGSLFSRRVAEIAMQDGSKAEAYIYVYNGSVKTEDRIPLGRQPWRKEG